jgi:hypothetical protein
MRPAERNAGRGGRGLSWLPPRPFFCAVLLLTGCRGLGKPDTKYDLLEAELRTRERELGECRAELNHLRLLNQTYQRQGVPCADPSFHPGPGGVPTLPLRDVTLGNGTGGVDDDGRLGDESLMAVVVPRDDDGAGVKVPARLVVFAAEVSPEGLKTPIGKWEVPPEQLRKTWRSGTFSSGYFVPLQWDRPPRTNRVRVSVRLVTLDGREFEADKDVTVRPLPGAGLGGGQGVVPVPPADVPELPPPTPAARLKVPKL